MTPRSRFFLPARLPAHFQIPFLGLLLFLAVAVYELVLPSDRPLWLVVSGATIAATYLRPPTAAMLGWVLVLLLAAYLSVNSAFNPVSGASWLTLLLIPWLPPLASNVADYVRGISRQLERQRTLLDNQANLHAATDLPGAIIAAQLLPSLNAHIRRQHHQAALIDVQVSNFAVLRSLLSAEELAEVQRGLRDALRRTLRGSDWLFQTADDHLLIMVDLGERAEGAVPAEVQQLYGDIRQSIAGLLQGSEQLRRAASGDGPGSARTSGQRVLLDKLQHSLAPLPQLELAVRALSLPDHLPPFETLLKDVRQQPLQQAPAQAMWDSEDGG